MTRVAALGAIIAGLLLIIVPRYVLPACEFEGFSRMHCSDTAQAEVVTGVLLLLSGAVVLAIRSRWSAIAGACLSLGLSVTAYAIPDRFGYCHSPKMPCNYGMVPAIRLIAVICALLAAAGIVSLLLQQFKKGKA